MGKVHNNVMCLLYIEVAYYCPKCRRELSLRPVLIWAGMRTATHVNPTLTGVLVLIRTKTHTAA